jgi:hypothetical protein
VEHLRQSWLRLVASNGATVTQFEEGQAVIVRSRDKKTGDETELRGMITGVGTNDRGVPIFYVRTPAGFVHARAEQLTKAGGKEWVSDEEKIRNAEIMYGTGSPEHLEAILRFGLTGVTASDYSTAMNEKRVRTSGSGKVHFAKSIRNPWKPGELVPAPACTGSSGTLRGAYEVADGTEVTCQRCKSLGERKGWTSEPSR